VTKWFTPAPLPARPGRRDGKAWLAFATSVVLMITFSQGWVMALTGPDGDAEASTLIRTLYFPAYFAALVLGATRLPQTLYAVLRTPVLWLLVGMVFVSVLWSTDPQVTERRGIAVLFTTLTGLVVASRYDWPELLEVLGAAFVILIFGSFLFGIALPSYGRMTTLFPGSWRGVWFEKNTLGANMSIATVVFCAAALLNPKRRWIWIGMIGLALALMLLSKSKTSLVALALGVGALCAVLVARRGPVLAVLTTFLGVSALLVIGFLFYFDSDTLFALLGKDATLTGRTKLWAAIMTQLNTRPWTGFGYSAVWSDPGVWGPLAWISKQAGFTAVHSHNSWLEIWVSLGYVGLGLWVLYFVEVWVRGILATYRSPGGYIALPFLAIFSLMTITETVALVYNNFIWVMFVALGVKLATPAPAPAAAPAPTPAPAPMTGSVEPAAAVPSKAPARANFAAPRP
jgi:exopolysaccharide production protein ExoQ